MSEDTPTAEERYRLLVEGARDYAMILLDPEGRVTSWNMGAERILGWREGEVIGQPVDLIFTPEDRAADVPARELERARAEGRAMDLRWHLKEDGARFYADGIMECLRDESGRVRGFAKIMRDATERRRAEEALVQYARLSMLAAEVGRALTTRRTLADMLGGCVEAIVAHLDAAFARVWVLDEAQDVLVLRASAGQYTHLDGPHGRIPVGQFKIGRIAQTRQPHLTNGVVGDPRVSDQAWAVREGMVAFAGYPLVIGERLVGVVALFARRPLPEATLQALGAVADQIAVGIDRQRAEAALRESEARKSAILEAALDCIITIDEQERVVEWNPAAERTFGYAQAQAVGQPLSELIIPHALREAHGRGIVHYLATGEGPVLNRRVEVPVLHGDGHEFRMELTAVPIGLDGRTLFTAYLRDLTERERAAAQQRAFLHDVLLSVTEGRLRLCHAPSDLPTPLPACGEPIPLSMTGGIRDLRHQAKEAAIAQGFAEERWHDLVTATSEAGMNAVVHAGRGQGRVCANADMIQVWVEDAGQGIDVARLPRATLKKGYSSAGTLGHGMKMMLSTSDRVFLLTGPTGTTVVLEQERQSPSPDWL